MRSIVQWFQAVVDRGLALIGNGLSSWTKPITAPTRGIITDLAWSKSELLAEHLLLRQQLIVLKRLVKRPRLTQTDCAFFVLLASPLQRWKEALLIVKPEMILW